MEFLDRAARVVAVGLRAVTGLAARVHPLAPLLTAALLAYGAAELTLWAERLPLGYLWRIFGWVTRYDPARLEAYNTLAHIAAFIVAFKIVVTMRWLGGSRE